MKKANIVFIAKSLDGYIADKDGGIEWLHSVPNPDGIDMGFGALMERVDAIVMGRSTFEMVCSFDIEWPYTKPVFVLSNTINSLDEKYKGKVEIVKGSLKEILKNINGKGFKTLYIDGGSVIQSFLMEDLIDEMVLTTIPVLLGGGVSLFGEIPEMMQFQHVKSEVFLNAITQDTYKRKR